MCTWVYTEKSVLSPIITKAQQIGVEAKLI